MLSLFVAGLLHLVNRLRSGFERYTYNDDNIYDSILEENKPINKPYTRFTAICFLIVGVGVSLVIGLLIGNYLGLFIGANMPSFFSPTLKPEFIFYPPIVVLFVDLMHTFASRFDY